MKVLIVEDCPDDAELLCAELSRSGEEVVYKRVDSDREMRAALRDEDWDIVISDHSMPQFSSLEALQALKDSGKDIPFIIYSGDMSEQMAVLAMQEGVQDFVRKGHAARLLPLVRRELSSAAARNAKKAAESNVYRLSHFDPLTGLANRDFFSEEVGAALQSLSAGGGHAAVCLINIDRFTEVNHAVGFAEGDKVLKQLAERLRRRVTPGGRLARLNGDRFAVFSGLLEQPALRDFADGIVGCVDAPFLAGATEVYLTLSMGIATFPRDGEDISALLVNAEAAAVMAKRTCGNCYRFYLQEMAQTTSRRMTLEAGLRHAAERGELTLHYQPIMTLPTERMAAVEALLRWMHPEYGLLAPDYFIPIADETRLIVPIGAWVLEEGCRQLKVLQERQFPGIGMCINVSPAQFASKDVLKHVDRAIRSSGIDASALEIEITESVLMRDVDGTIATLKALKDLGIRISVDDFGTGYSSLSYLKRFPIDTLKIDRTFIRDIARDPDDYAIVCAIIALARSLHLTVIAEGVESADQAAALRRENCDFVQGHYYGKAMPAEDLERLLGAARTVKLAVAN